MLNIFLTGLNFMHEIETTASFYSFDSILHRKSVTIPL